MDGFTDRLVGPPAALDDIRSRLLDPRLAEVLQMLLEQHVLRLGYVKSGHPMGPTSPAGRVNSHHFYAALDIHAVDGCEVVDRPLPESVVEVGRLLLSLPATARPDEVMGPSVWHARLDSYGQPGFRTDDHANAIHSDHLHLGFKQRTLE